MEEDTGVTAVPAVPEHASTADVTSPTVVTMDSADAHAGAPREIWSHSPDSCGVSAFLAFWSVNQTITLYFP